MACPPIELVPPFNWSSHSTGPPIQLVPPFNWSPNTGQFGDKESRGPLGAIFLSRGRKSPLIWAGCIRSFCCSHIHRGSAMMPLEWVRLLDVIAGSVRIRRHHFPAGASTSDFIYRVRALFSQITGITPNCLLLYSLIGVRSETTCRSCTCMIWA